VVDRLRQLGVENVHEIWFGDKGGEAIWAGDLDVRTANKRAQMWANMRAWLPGGAIPDCDALAADLTGTEYGYAADQVSIVLEKEGTHEGARPGQPGRGRRAGADLRGSGGGEMAGACGACVAVGAAG